MQPRSSHPALFGILAFIAGVPILFAFLLAGTPVLIPMLVYQWLTSGTDPSQDGGVSVRCAA